MVEQKSISIICPVLNEEKFIEGILKFYASSGIKNKELFIVDGGSEDRTALIVADWCNKDNSIKLLNNPDRYVPQAINKAIRLAKGEIIIRLDAHTEYAPDYFDKIIETFETTDADIVGGPMNAVGKTTIQRAVAFATSGSFGIGNSKFHDINYKGYVDSVYLGAWKKELFSDIGLFDERMVRNQDDEFHYRARSKGKKIFLSPLIKSYYYPRSTFSSLFKQYFQYGLYKPLVIKKIKSEIKIRHLVPLFFVLYLFCLLFLFQFPVLFIPLILYCLGAIYSCLNSKLKIKEILAVLIVYPVLHVSYGIGFLLGLFKLIRN